MDGRGDLDRDRPAQFSLGGGGRGADQAGPGGGDAVGGEELPGRLGVGPPAAGLAGKPPAGQFAPAARVDAGGVTTWPAGRARHSAHRAICPSAAAACSG